MLQKVTLSTRQRRAIEALISSPTLTAAAEKAGLARATLHRYLRDPAFSKALRERQEEITAGVTASLIGLSGGALIALGNALADRDASHSERISAVRAWTSWMEKRIESDGLVARIEAIEQVIAEKERNGER